MAMKIYPILVYVNEQFVNGFVGWNASQPIGIGANIDFDAGADYSPTAEYMDSRELAALRDERKVVQLATAGNVNFRLYAYVTGIDTAAVENAPPVVTAISFVVAPEPSEQRYFQRVHVV